jgi:hypothetical protein
MIFQRFKVAAATVKQARCLLTSRKKQMFFSSIRELHLVLLPKVVLYAFNPDFKVLISGINNIEYRSIDEKGIPAKVKSTTIKLDNNAPVTTVAASPIDGNNGWYISNPT